MLKKSIVGLLVILWGSIAVAQNTTLWIVRHAEKDTAQANRANPDLSEKGKQRALDLADYLKKVKIALIYSTDTKRTKQTAAHFAMPIEIYNPKNLAELTVQIREKSKGKTILIVGHSNTVLETIEALGGQRPVKQLNDDDYDYIFKVEIGTESKSKVEAFQFGQPHRGGTATMR
ncbi:SixA phosphatase family protein [Sediminibacterium sp.]|uniref:SixA phosphatase family protein n=1 Tax=Sediminibacterium sp. TaxID=1917865 RepID=UPI003F714D06